MTARIEYYKSHRADIEGALIDDAKSWLNSFNQGFDGVLRLDDNAHELPGAGKDKGKVAYMGSMRTNKGASYITLTIIFQRASVPNESYKGSRAIREQLWDNYKRCGNTHCFRPNATTIDVQLNRAAKAKHQSEAKREAAKKAANVKRDLAKYGGLSNDHQGNQAAYLTKKKLNDFIPRGSVRYGTDKHGDFTAIQLVNLESGKPVGIQRFYDRSIKDRKTNKDFTWGMVKSGACHILGEIDKDYAGLLTICEGYADGVVAHNRTQAPVIIGLDAGNLDAVTQAAKVKYTKADIVVICDNDAHKYDRVDNGGVLKGVEAAGKAGCKYIIPDFSGYDQSGKPKDLWDLWQLGGDEAVDALLNSPQESP
ncbi:MAG: toprim domain-containing protein [Pseudomonadota bacterium]